MFLRQKYANTAVPPTLVQEEPPAARHYYQLPLHLVHQLPTSCSSLLVGHPAMTSVPALPCGAQQVIACGHGVTGADGNVDTGVWRPSKKRRLIQRRRESKLFGVEARLEDLGVGPDGERLKKRAKVMKRKNESLEQKLRRKLNHPSLKPWDRAALSEIYPSSSDDEAAGWIPSGEYMRSLFDLPETKWEEEEDDRSSRDKKDRA